MLRVDEVANSPVVPAEVDVVIIGGGIIGTSTGYELARQGVSVALVEKGFIAAEQSRRNWGWVRQQNRRHDELVMAMRSLKRWSEFGDEIGRDLGFRRQGSMYGTTSEADVAKWEKRAVRAKEIGYSFDILSAAEIRSRIPDSTAPWVGGLWSPPYGLAEPSMAAPAIAEGAKNSACTCDKPARRGVWISVRAVY